MKPNLLSDKDKGAVDSEDERWIRHMLALVGQPLKRPLSDGDTLTHNEQVIRDFLDGRGIFAEEEV